MKVIIEIPDKVYENAKNGMLDDLQSMLICGSVTEGKAFPNGTTHRDIICHMFPDYMFCEDSNCGYVYLADGMKDAGLIRIDKELWHRPYKESEG